jgi:hypothetical protein
VGVRRDISEVILSELKFLAFLPARPDMERLRWYFLALGLASTWIVGLGRYWDAPEANWWQYAGLGSLVYTLFMSAFLWALIMPMDPENWTYLNVVTFMGMTAPPALLYAIPVERLVEPALASQFNYIFLLVVSLWRVGLLWCFLRRAARLKFVSTLFALAFPLVLILTFLTLRQWQHNVMGGMSGNRGELHRGTPDIAYLIISKIGFYSVLLCPVTFLGYAICSAEAKDLKAKAARQAVLQAQQTTLPDPATKHDGEV